MFGRRKKALTRAEKLRLKAAYAAGRVGPHVSKAADAAQRAADAAQRAAAVAAEAVAPQVERAREFAGPRLSALQQTAAVAVAPKLDKARRRSSAALDVLRGAEPVVVVEKKHRRWPLALLGLVLGVAAGAVARRGNGQTLVERVRPVPTLVPHERDVVILDDVRTTAETTTTMPDRVDGS